MAERRGARGRVAGAVLPIAVTFVALVVGAYLFLGEFAAAPRTGATLGSIPPLAVGDASASTAGSVPLGPTPPPAASPAAGEVAVLVGAGDISRCRPTADDATARLIESIIAETPHAQVFTAGDNAYEEGSAQQFATCYQPTWGRFKNRTHPALGNHDYVTPLAKPYFDYFGAAAGRRGEGWYSFNVGTWHVVVLNSNCEFVDCTAGSAQETWLRGDLARSDARCTIAIWHHPRWSSSKHGSMPRTDTFYRDLFAHGAELLIVGHGHQYERFAPQDPNGNANEANGIREIMVGTGGTTLEPFVGVAPNSEVRNARTHGVLKLTLHRDSYDWQFIPVDGTFTDAGSGTCH